MENTIYNVDAHIFSIKTSAPARRFTISQILKKIGCKHLSLEKVLTDGGNYFLFTYDTHPNLEGEDRPEWADWAQHSVNVHQLNHISINDWVSEGSELANAMRDTQ